MRSPDSKEAAGRSEPGADAFAQVHTGLYNSRCNSGNAQRGGFLGPPLTRTEWARVSRVGVLAAQCDPVHPASLVNLTPLHPGVGHLGSLKDSARPITMLL